MSHGKSISYIPHQCELMVISTSVFENGNISRRGSVWNNNGEHNIYYIHCKNERSFQSFLGYLNCFCSYVSIMGHIQSILIHNLQCHILNIFQYDSSMYKRICKRENYESGEIQRLGTGVVHYLGTGPKAFISIIQCFGTGPAIFISLVHSTFPQQQD